MVNAINQIIKIIVDSDVNKAVAGLKKVEKAQKKMIVHTETTMKTIGKVTDKVTRSYDKFGNVVRTKTSRMISDMRKFPFHLLSIMFTFMALSRILNSFWRGASETMKKIEGLTSAWTKGTMKLSAAWEFLKYRLLDVLGQSPVFQMIVDFFVDLLNAVVNMDDDKLAFIAGTLAVLTAASTVAMGAAMIGMGVNGILNLVSAMSKFSLPTATTITSFLTFLSGAAGIVSVAIGIAIAWDLFKTGPDLLKELGMIIAFGLGGTLIGAALGGPAGALIGLVVGLSAGVLIDMFLMFKWKNQEATQPWNIGEGETFEGTGVAVVDQFSSIGDLSSQIASQIESNVGAGSPTEEAFNNFGQSIEDTNSLLAASLLSETTPEAITTLGDTINENLVTSLDNSTIAAEATNAELGKIPEEIVTVHRIITVNETRSE